MNFPAANRDPVKFEDPDKVILDREENPHIAFGVGIHRCAGSNLARMEMRVSIEEWLKRIPDYRLEDPERHVGRRSGARPAHDRWSCGRRDDPLDPHVDSAKCQGHNRCYQTAPDCSRSTTTATRRRAARARSRMRRRSNWLSEPPITAPRRRSSSRTSSPSRQNETVGAQRAVPLSYCRGPVSAACGRTLVRPPAARRAVPSPRSGRRVRTLSSAGCCSAPPPMSAATGRFLSGRWRQPPELRFDLR